MRARALVGLVLASLVTGCTAVSEVAGEGSRRPHQADLLADASASGSGTSDGGQARERYLAMARQMPDLTLGIGYLIVSNMVRLLERVQRSPRETLDFPPDSRSGRVQVTSANAAPWLADYRARVAAYRQAIEERGPASVSGAYELSAAPGCGLEVQLPVLAWLARRQAETGPSGDLPPEGLLPEGARIDQEGGVLTLTVALRTRVGPREMLGHGVAVGRTLVATDLDEAEVFLAGQAQGGRIVLRPSVEYSRPLATASDESSDPARCEVTLTRERP